MMSHTTGAFGGTAQGTAAVMARLAQVLYSQAPTAFPSKNDAYAYTPPPMLSEDGLAPNTQDALWQRYSVTLALTGRAPLSGSTTLAQKGYTLTPALPKFFGGGETYVPGSFAQFFTAQMTQGEYANFRTDINSWIKGQASAKQIADVEDAASRVLGYGVLHYMTAVAQADGVDGIIVEVSPPSVRPSSLQVATDSQAIAQTKKTGAEAYNVGIYKRPDDFSQWCNFLGNMLGQWLVYVWELRNSATSTPPPKPVEAQQAPPVIVLRFASEFNRPFDQEKSPYNTGIFDYESTDTKAPPGPKPKDYVTGFEAFRQHVLAGATLALGTEAQARRYLKFAIVFHAHSKQVENQVIDGKTVLKTTITDVADVNNEVPNFLPADLSKVDFLGVDMYGEVTKTPPWTNDPGHGAIGVSTLLRAFAKAAPGKPWLVAETARGFTDKDVAGKTVDQKTGVTTGTAGLVEYFLDEQPAKFNTGLPSETSPGPTTSEDLAKLVKIAYKSGERLYFTDYWRGHWLSSHPPTTALPASPT